MAWKKKKKKEGLSVRIEGSNVSEGVAKALEARARNKKTEAEEFKKLAPKHRAGEPLPASEELKKRKFIPRTETHPEEFVERGGRLVSPTAALMAESMRQEEEAMKGQESEEDVGTEFLRKIPLIGKPIAGSRKVLGKTISAGAYTSPIARLMGVGEEERAQIEKAFGLVPGQSFFKDKDVQSFGMTLATVGIGGLLWRGLATKMGGGIIPQGINVDRLVKTHGLTKAQASKVATELGRRRVNQAAEMLVKAETPMIRKILASGWTKLGVGAMSGVAITTGWLASDNILTGSTFSAKLVQESVEAGTISKAEGIILMDEIQEWNNGAESFIRGRDKIDPLTWGALGKPYLINAEKSQRDLAMRRELLLVS